MDNLTIDLRQNADFKKGHLPSRYRWILILIYVAILGLAGLLFYQLFSIQKAKAQIALIRSEAIIFSSKMEEAKNADLVVQGLSTKAQALVAWQENSVHLQSILNGLLSKLPKEVLLECFTFKKEKIPQQALISLELKGNHSQLVETLENIPFNLEVLGLKLISMEQMEIPDGVRLQYLCQIETKESLC